MLPFRPSSRPSPALGIAEVFTGEEKEHDLSVEEHYSASRLKLTLSEPGRFGGAVALLERRAAVRIILGSLLALGP
jgi:hypothetical protein